jgi:hypothetical protein
VVILDEGVTWNQVYAWVNNDNITVNNDNITGNTEIY